MSEELKKGVLLQIEDRIETLQLRMMLNYQTINEELADFPELKTAIEYFRSVEKQNIQANDVIRECETSIEKLILLKKHLPNLSLDTTVNLISNYDNYTLENFRIRLLQLNLTTD